MSADHDADALRYLKRDARQGKPGGANALARELQRRKRADERAAKDATRASKRSPTAAGAFSTPGTLPDGALTEEEWRAHNDDRPACSCDGCQEYAAAVLASIASIYD